MTARVHQPDGRIPPACRPMLLLPAMGVAPSYYRTLVEQLARLGFAVTVADLNGSKSPARPPRGYVEIVEQLIPAAYQRAQDSAPGEPVVVLGHSLGGQLGLVAAGEHFPHAPFVLVASGVAHWRAFSLLRGIFYLAGSQTIGASARLLGSWPGHRLGFGGRQSAATMLDWARNVRNGEYSSARASFDYADALARFQGEVLAIHVAQDRLAPIAATEALLSRTSTASVTSIDYTASRGEARPGSHFTWAKDLPGVDAEIDAWTSRITAGRRAALDRIKEHNHE